MANRLASESSPYLIQHAENPVEWFPWGDEAFAEAQKTDKPIFISIGYAACHWCHVMAHESFEDRETAELMNELFINIKIDREERPDVDSVYMNAIHVMGEGGGWPLSAFCDSSGRPYFLGTYFPPSRRYGRPSFSEVLRTMARVYREERDQVEHNAVAVLDGLKHLDDHYRRGGVGNTEADLDSSLIAIAGRTLAERCDRTLGGFGDKPKFPSSSAHHFLARASRYTFGQPARSAFLLQAAKMAEGGIYDHLGGGFARYSVDEKWLVPHFEKMLYDNAQLLGIYADAFAISGRKLYARVIEQTVDWLAREMTDPSGGLYASQDADSEGIEGKFYVWTPEEIRDVLGPADAIVFNAAYGVSEAGNFEDQMTVLSRVTARGSSADEAAIGAMISRLREARSSRVRPATDTKVLSSWNGLAISGLVAAWSKTGHQPALDQAVAIAEFLAEAMITKTTSKDGKQMSALARVYKDGDSKLDGTLDDYAFVARGFVDLAFASGRESFFELATSLVVTIRERFYADVGEHPVLFLTAKDGGDHLVHRPESHQDGAIPAGASVAIECLLIVGQLTGDAEAFELAERYLVARAPQMAKHPFMGARLLAALDLYFDAHELVVTDGEGREALIAAARGAFAPNLLWAGKWAHTLITSGKEASADGLAQAFVCRRGACSTPTSDPAALSAQLSGPPE